jgi:hypothetical protein
MSGYSQMCPPGWPYAGLGFGFGYGGLGGGFGPNNLMAGLGCFQYDVNNNLGGQGLGENILPTQGQIDAPAFKIDLCELNEATERYSKPTLIAGACFDVIFKQEIESNIFKEANYNVYGIPPNGSKDEYFSPYFLLGASVFQFNPQTYYNSRWVDLRPLGTEGQFKGKEYYTVSSAFLFGVGLKYDLSERWSMQFELSGRTTFTDYLDDVSSVYPDRRNLFLERGQFGSMAVALSDRSLTSASLPTQDIGKKGFMRGNVDNKDAYAFLEVGFLYFFGNLRCPDISRRK